MLVLCLSRTRSTAWIVLTAVRASVHRSLQAEEFCFAGIRTHHGRVVSNANPEHGSAEASGYAE